jgi:hypothetical protein
MKGEDEKKRRGKERGTHATRIARDSVSRLKQSLRDNDIEVENKLLVYKDTQDLLEKDIINLHNTKSN